MFNTKQIGLAKFTTKTYKENKEWKTKKMERCYIWISIQYTRIYSI